MKTSINITFDKDISNFTYLLSNKKSYQNLTLWNFVSSHSIKEFYTDKLNSEIFKQLQKIDKSIYQNTNLNPELLLKFNTIQNDFSNFVNKLQKLKMSEFELFYDRLRIFFKHDQVKIHEIKVFTSPFIKLLNGKEYPSSYRGANVNNSVIILPIALDGDFNETSLLKLLLHEIVHIFDYYSAVDNLDSILYKTTSELIDLTKNQIPLASNFRNIEIQKILLESIVNAISHLRYGLFSESILEEKNTNKDYLNKLVASKKITTIGDLQMLSGWMILPTVRRYLVKKKSIDAQIFLEVIMNLKKLTT